MAEGKGIEAWGHTAAILALLANIHRDPKKSRAFSPADFNPYHAQTPKVVEPKLPDLSLLKTVFVDNPKGKGGSHA
jgi:hypothetical protein